ncbi:MAG: concentrative nucleoside transporter, family, partial [Candidatus Hydrogenedentes bacterium]|nr:concentrative nucleoside transporter, family [Candidatus Hydrogenedentota bacterium]
IGLVHLLDMGITAATGHGFTQIMGWFFRPFAFLMGVPWNDVPAVAELLGTKTVLNEFLAYSNLTPLIKDQVIGPRSIVIATYALCGFANPGSMAIAIGGLSGLVPERRAEIAQLGIKSFVGGTLACFMTACVAGIIIHG